MGAMAAAGFGRPPPGQDPLSWKIFDHMRLSGDSGRVVA
jgi:hypothetical protein